MSAKTKKYLNDFAVKYSKKFNLDLTYFISNGSWLLLQQIVGTAGGILLAITFARLVDKNIFGQYQLAIAIISLVSILALPGLNIAASQSIARGNEGDYTLAVKRSFYWSLLGIPVLICLGAYYILFQGQHAFGITLIAASLIFPFFYSPNTWNGFYIGKQMFRLSSKLYSFQALTAASLIIFTIIFFRNNLLFLVLAYCMSYATLNCIYYIRSLRYVSNTKMDPTTIRYGYFLTFTFSFEILSENIDKMLVAFFLSPVHLAIFAIVSILPFRFKSIFKPIFNVVFPKLSSSDLTLPKILKNNSKAILWFFLVIALGSLLYLISIEKICYLFFGKNYADYYFYAKYFVVYIFLAFPMLFIEKYLQAKKHQKAILFSTGPIFVVLKSTMIISGIYWKGLMGAIIAINLAIMLKFILSIFLIKEKYAN